MAWIETDKDHWLSRPVLVAGAGVLAVIAAIGLNFFFTEREEVPAPAASSATPKPISPPAVPDATAFDVVRVDAAGNMVAAGQAPPLSQVIVRDGDTIVGEVTADERGDWVLVPEQPLAPGAHQLTVELRAPSGAVDRPAEQVLVIVPAKDRDVAGRSGDPSETLILRYPTPAGSAPAVLQKPLTESSVGSLAIDAVEYDETGQIAISGRGLPGAHLRLKIDDRPLADTTVEPSGHWQVRGRGNLAPGGHTLHVVQLLDGGQTKSRLSLGLVLEPPANIQVPPGRIVVQSGESLWRIARRTYGRGIAYSIIYEANDEAIRNPNLIYPGQTLALPDHP